MALHHAVLALLHDAPRHGYDLRGEFEALVGPQFGRLNIGHLYQLLDRLTRDGLAEAHREPQEGRPDRIVHTLTEKGATELAAWLETPSRAGSGYRDDFFLKIAAARRAQDADLLHRVVDQRRTTLVQELRDLSSLRSTGPASSYDDLLASAAEIQARGLLELLDRIDNAIPQLIAEEREARRPAAVAESSPDPADNRQAS